MISGVFGALSVSPMCIIAGVMMMCVALLVETHSTFSFSLFRLLGFALIMFEVPICCQFVQYTQPVAQFSQERPAWQKAVLYSACVPFIEH